MKIRPSLEDIEFLSWLLFRFDRNVHDLAEAERRTLYYVKISKETGRHIQEICDRIITYWKVDKGEIEAYRTFDKPKKQK